MPDEPLLPTSCQVDTSHEPAPAPQATNTFGRYQRTLEVLLHIEPFWVLAAGSLVYVSYHLRLPLGLSWLWLALALLPAALRVIRDRRLVWSTPFDAPIWLLMAGALLGVIISPALEISLGAFQCMLALTFAYYAWVNHPNLRTIMPWLAVIALIGVLAHSSISLLKMNGSMLSPGDRDCTYHGLALTLTMAAMIFAGMALFGRGRRTRTASGVVSIVLLVCVLLLVGDSIPRLAIGDSVDGRLPRWEATVDLLKDSPFTGLGLGCWPIAYHGSTSFTSPTSVHNSYLDLPANLGILGVLSLLAAIAVALKIGAEIWRSKRGDMWRAVGLGAMLAAFATAAVGLIESSPLGVPMLGESDYRYLVSPAPWILAGLLVSMWRLKGPTNQC